MVELPHDGAAKLERAEETSFLRKLDQTNFLRKFGSFAEGSLSRVFAENSFFPPMTGAENSRRG
ncbi:MAG: hypothetical protein HZT43_15080 [Exiguobacterium profundum]|nr:MAG: hypothetical protein HZT43_15080 [Exiguobacterium profundum]